MTAPTRSAGVLSCSFSLALGCADAPGASASLDDGALSIGDDAGTSAGESESSGDDAADDETDAAAACAGACSDDEVCLDDACCPIASACGDVCCGTDSVCSFQQCVVPGADCIDATECPDGSYCEYALGEPATADVGMCAGGASLATGKCLPQPPQCAPGERPDVDALDCLPACEYVPDSNFTPTTKYEWIAANVQMTPVVIQLDDDDCNDVVDERDIPEIVFVSFDGAQTMANGTLRVVGIVDGTLVEKWSKKSTAPTLRGNVAIAAGDIDGVPGNEIVACTDTTAVRAFRADGSDMWVSAATGSCDQPSIADLDQDGVAEIITERAVLDGESGAIELALPQVGQSWWLEHVIAADITGDGVLDLVAPSRAWTHDGTPLVVGAPRGTFPAVADLDDDGRPEVVSVLNVGSGGIHEIEVWRYDALAPGGFEVVRTGVDINGPLPATACGATTYGRVSGGGPPTIADFDGDGTPDVGVAGGVGYAVFSGALLVDPDVTNEATMSWIVPSQDCSSAFTGSSVFDFDGDGITEVIYADEEMLRIYSGPDGETLFEACNTSNTAHEYPVIADVDNDGHADIVVVSNNHQTHTCLIDGSTTRGVRVFGDVEGRWVRTRRVWNQHAYHVTNVAEDGSIPPVESANWTLAGLNDFRKNVQPEGEWSAPDLVASVVRTCSIDEQRVSGRVRNIGRAAAPTGVAVSFWAGDPAGDGVRIGEGETSKVLYPAEAQDVPFDGELPDDVASGAIELWFVVDEGGASHPWHECRTDNNTAHDVAKCDVAG